MTARQLQALLADGLAAHQAGRLIDAERCYRRTLAAAPKQPDALHLLAVLALQRGCPTEAQALARQALDAAPRQPTFWNTLGAAHRAAGQHAEAADAFRQAVALGPEYAEGWANLAAASEALGDAAGEDAALEQLVRLQPGHARAWGRRGVLAYQRGQIEAAAACFDAATRLAPDDAEAWSNLGVAQLRLGQLATAEASQRRAVALRPDFAAAQNNLGNVLVARSRWAEAVTVLEPLVQAVPDDANAWLNLGHARRGLGRHAEAHDAFERALALRPDDPTALVGLGDALRGLDEYEQAVEAYHRAIAQRPDDAEAYEHLGIALQSLGQLDAAEATLRRCLELDPDRPAVHSGLIFVLDLQEGAEAEAARERRRWNARFGRGAHGYRAAHANDPDPDRPLRVGYVSADLRHHSAAYAILPLLRAHDRAQVTVACYSGVTAPDAVTEQIRALADLWRDAAYWSDDELERQIRADSIDVLVDLSGHSGGNRLPVFAREPAPVQITAWGYAASTGLDAIGYFLADVIVVPPEARAGYSEEVVSLPSVLCYEPPAYTPPLAPLPARERGFVTFGAFNRLPKISDEAVAAWARALAAVPNSRLVVKCAGADRAPARERLLARLAERGVGAERVTLLGSTPHAAHLAAHAEIDLMLDTFPQSGGITTLDALLMGVPVVTLLGRRVPGRVSASCLTTLGLADLVAATPDAYVEIAARLAGDLDRLAHERATLRERLLASPLANARAYTRAVEGAYRELWRRWAATQESVGRGQSAVGSGDDGVPWPSGGGLGAGRDAFPAGCETAP